MSSRLRSLAFRARRESDLNEELRLHLEREVERLQATGLTLEDARHRAHVQFGGVEAIKEECRDARGTGGWDAITRDARQGIRRLMRDWRFTIAGVLILGLGIGVNTAVFSLVNAVFFRESPVNQPDRLVNIYQNDRAGQPLVVTTYAAYTEIAASSVFATVMAASMPEPVRYLHEGGIRNAVTEYGTATYLQVLGLHPSLGRWFDASEERAGAPLVGVLGFETWRRTFHADRSVIGRVIHIEGLPVTIIGVAPSEHRGIVDVGLATDLFLPIGALREMSPNPAARTAATIHVPLLVKARLRDGTGVAQAVAAMNVLGQRLVAEYPQEYQTTGEFALGPGITVVPSATVRIHPRADRPILAIATLILIIVGLVLAIACSNLATLLLVRGATRAREVSVRLAMGATRRQVVRLLLIEHLLLAITGGGIGCLAAWWGIRILRAMPLPVNVDFSIDVRVLIFTTALALATGIAFGLAPALTATRIDLLPALRDDATPTVESRRLTLKNALIVMQVSVSVLLLGITSVFLQQLSAAKALRIGFAVDGVAMLETDVRFTGRSAAASKGVYEELLRRVTAIPGVQAATLLRGLPMTSTSIAIVVDGLPLARPARQAAMLAAGPGFFDTLRIPLLYGRVFDAGDRENTPRVAVITERMAREYFGTVNAVGRRFRRELDPNSWMEVIGVVRDTGTGNFDDDVLDPIPPPFYVSHTQDDALPTVVIARTSGDASPLVAAMQRQLRALDPTLPAITATTMAQALERSQAAPRAVATFLAVLGGLGLLLASIGLYAVVAFAVARRSREIGIRMALGAHSQQVVATIARGVAGMVGIGTAIGLVLSVLVMLALRASSSAGDIGIGSIAVYRPDIDPLALLAIAGVTAAVGVAAAFVPARRAARMHPLLALRHD
jgi:predicted permease